MKRLVMLILLLLVANLAGAIVNVAVAWAAMFSYGSMSDIFGTAVKEVWDSRSRLSRSEEEPMFKFECAGRSAAKKVHGDSSVEIVRTVLESRPRSSIRQTTYFEAWSSRVKDNSDGTSAQLTSRFPVTICVATGWPAPAIGVLRVYGPKQPVGMFWEVGWELTNLVRANSSSQPYVVPLKPLWLGFAINTVFYAVVLWLLFAAPFALRRRRRIKRGLCPKCAYPVGASDVCTECGAAVTPSAHPTMPHPESRLDAIP